MAYRFLLEVPEALAGDAGVAVEEAGDAQVVVVRQSHGLGYDDARVDLTVAAHSLRVIDALYGWFDQMGASRPDIRIVLHGGDRLALEAADRGAMVAAIRRDQPWVERTLPKIGEHEDDFAAEDAARTARERRMVDGAGDNAPGRAPDGAPGAGDPRGASWLSSGAVAVRPDRTVRIKALNHVAVQVMDLPKAERFYADFFGMDLIGRARRGPRGGFQPLGPDYRWDEAIRTGTEADVAFVAGGPVTLALGRAGRGARLDRAAALDTLSIAVDATTFATLRGEILMRGFEVLATAETALTFRDPFTVVWELTIQGTPGLS